MNTWQAAQRLAQSELKRELPAYVFAVFATVLLGLFTSTFFLNDVIYFSLDIFFLYLTPTIGMAQSNAYFSFHYRKSDPFTRRLFFLRSLPISTDAIVLSRFQLLALSHICLLPIFFVLPYIVSETYRDLLQPGQLIMFMFLWFGYSLLISSMFHCFELSTSGKVLFWSGLGFGIVLLLVIVMLRSLNTSVVALAIRLAQEGPFYPLLIFFTGIVGALLWKKATQKRIANRDLYLD